MDEISQSKMAAETTPDLSEGGLLEAGAALKSPPPPAHLSRRSAGHARRSITTKEEGLESAIHRFCLRCSVGP